MARAKPLCRQSGKYQWDAKVAVMQDGKRQQAAPVNITVFCDTRDDAIAAACNEVKRFGYTNCTVDHITRIR